MNKRGAVQYIVILLFILAFLFIFTNIFDNFKSKLNDGSLLTNVISINTTKETRETIYNTQTITEKPNLCNVLGPYILPSGVQNECIISGGTWRCDSTFTGCSDLPLPIVDCSGPAITASTYQCQELGGVAVCKPTNIYCYYP